VWHRQGVPPPSRTQPADQRSVRSHNLALALGEVAGAASPVSRADIATATGMTRATASSLVETLVAAGMVTELAPRMGPQGGRPATGLTLSGDGPAALGLEINVDYVAACVLDLTGAVKHRDVAELAARDRTPAASAEALGRLAERATAAARRADLQVAGAALAVPGLVDAEGIVRLAPNLDWRDVDILGPVTRQTSLAGLPLTVDNEANLAALAELAAAPQDGSFLHVSGEIGIGAGIVVDGALHRGRHGWSGELGHVSIDPSGPECSCGSRGCLEQYAGQDAILRAAQLDPARGTSAGGDNALARLVQEAREGNVQVLEAIDRAGVALGVAVSTALNLLDLDHVVLGGIYAPLFPWIAPEVERQILRRVLSSQWEPPTVRRSALGGDAAVVGAARSVLQQVLADPGAYLT
jgi:predicted NBD/HSP70 family sugar kinase